jgi:protein-S-isoprenylcysteine O-methyltransferase Ste14
MPLTERRIARLVSIVVSAAVVVADVYLFVTFVRFLRDQLPPSWIWMIGTGIVLIFVFALWRLLNHIRLFRLDR